MPRFVLYIVGASAYETKMLTMCIFRVGTMSMEGTHFLSVLSHARSSGVFMGRKEIEGCGGIVNDVAKAMSPTFLYSERKSPSLDFFPDV